MNSFNKISEKREQRKDEVYNIDEMQHYSAVCPDHAGVRRLRVGDEEKVKLGYSKEDLVWKCPIDNKVYASEGGIDKQTDGFSAFNQNFTSEGPIIDEGFEAANKLRKMIGE
jgi:hypothetical protein